MDAPRYGNTVPNVASLSSDGTAVLVVVPVRGVTGDGQLAVPAGQAVLFSGHTVGCAGQRVSIVTHALTTGGHFVSLRGQNVSTVQTVGRGGHVVADIGQIVSTGGQLVSVIGQFVSVGGQNV